VALIFWVTNRMIRYDGFCTSYFFIAPFTEWLVTLPEKFTSPKTAPVKGQYTHLLKVLGVVVGFLATFVYIGFQVPQSIGLPPTREKLDVTTIKSGKDLARHGQNIFFGKGQCALCHTLGAESGRCPSLQNAGARLSREFIYESLTQPDAYIKLDFEEVDPKRFPARMPKINKPPIDLTDQEMLTVISFIQSQGGKVTVEPSELSVEEATAAPAPAAAQPPPPEKSRESRLEQGQKGS
jgi:mono/diheme cytochrome c family protein